MELIERLIVRRIIRSCKASGWVPVNVWDGGEYVPASTERAVLEAVDSVCTSTIHFAPKSDRKAWGNKGVYVVMGNGIDCLSDWHCGNESFNAAIEKAAEYVEKLAEMQS